MFARPIHIRPLTGLLAVLVLLSACSKADYSIFDDTDATYSEAGHKQGASERQAVGTLRTREGIRYIVLDPVSLGYIDNPEEVEGIPDGTRLFLSYLEIDRSGIPSFCTETIHLEWVSAIETGTVSYAAVAGASGDPVDIVTDWITSLEDGFLTLHYSIPASGKVQHTFSLAPGTGEGEYWLIHDARGDTGGELTEGIICFPVGELLPDTGGETVTLSLNYLNLKRIQTKLTVDYQSPK